MNIKWISSSEDDPYNLNETGLGQNGSVPNCPKWVERGQSLFVPNWR